MCISKLTDDLPPMIEGAKRVVEDDQTIEYTEDVLAVLTSQTRAVVFGVGDLLQKFQNSVYYRILCETTQPAHFVVAFAVTMISYLFLSTKEEQTVNLTPLWTFLYLGSFSAHFGAQLWMTFISGLALYFALPRHTFGSVQRVLFPKYFLLNASLSLVTLVVFVRSNRTALCTSAVLTQAVSLTLCFLTELLIRLYLTPPLLYLMHEKNELEKKAGVGLEVGKHDPKGLVNCPHYLKVHKSFRKVHMTIAIGNMFTMGTTILHLHYLANKICIV